MKRHESWRSLTAELISLAPAPICSSSDPAMFLLQKTALKCFDEWRNFCNPLSLGFFFPLFFFSLWLEIICFYLLLYFNLETRCCTWVPGFFCFLEENEEKQSWNIPVQAPAPALLLWGISTALQKDWLPRAYTMYMFVTPVLLGCLTPSKIQLNLPKKPTAALHWLQLFVGKSFLNSKTTKIILT